jgi:hypothetical protein
MFGLIYLNFPWIKNNISNKFVYLNESHAHFQLILILRGLEFNFGQYLSNK